MQGLFEGLSQWTEVNSIGTMAKKDRDANATSLKSGLEEIKLHLRKVYKVVGVGVKENMEMASDIRFISNQIGCHNSKIDDHKHDLRKLMGTMEIIKDEVLKMSRMS